ncbi:MAG: EamA family transporter RarD [Campylobacteraceae bacterium]|nr:EamA family transporter RarD [Campylobacteraceae bacterium]
MPNSFSQQQTGIICALGAFVLWGVFPVYFKLVDHIPPLEMLCHRIVWSVFFLSILLFFSRGFTEIKELFKLPLTVFLLFITGLLITLNWLAYIYAVANNMITEASLGYFINPLVNIVLGILFLKEKTSLLEKIAIAIAFFAIAIEIVKMGSMPYIALFLAFSFGFYGLIRKMIRVNSFTGLFIETLLIAPLAILYLIYLGSSHTLGFSFDSFSWIIMLSGPVTVIPLLLFTGAASRIKLGTIGFIQYLSPTITFSLAILVYNEPLSTSRVVTFALIWLSLIFVITDTFWQKRKKEIK